MDVYLCQSNGELKFTLIAPNDDEAIRKCRSRYHGIQIRLWEYLPNDNALRCVVDDFAAEGKVSIHTRMSL